MAKIKFFSLREVNFLQNLLILLFLNISCSFLQEKSTYFENFQKIFFRLFLKIMKNGLMYLDALTPSI